MNVNFTDVSFILPDEFLVQSNTSLEFDERLMFSGSGQICYVQISTDGGNTWNTEYSRSESILSSGNWDPASFITRAISLSTYDGESIKIRFLYDSAGSTITSYGTTTGWFIDDITILNAKVLGNVTEQDYGSEGNFTFNPASAGDYLIEVKSLNSDREFPYGSTTEISVVSGPAPSPVFDTSSITLSGSNYQINLNMANATMGEAKVRGHQDMLMLSSQSELSGVTIEHVSGDDYLIYVPVPAFDNYFYQVYVDR